MDFHADFKIYHSDSIFLKTSNFIKSNSQVLQKNFKVDDLLPMWIADTDFMVSSKITSALQQIVNRQIYAYEDISIKLKTVLTQYFNHKYPLNFKTEDCLLVPGVLSGISIAIQTLTNKNDAVLIQTPVYHQFEQLIKKNNRDLVVNPLLEIDGNYQIDWTDFEEKLKHPKMKVFLLCNPQNPVGRVWLLDELKKMADLTKKYGVIVISDEVHSEIVYQSHHFNSFAQFKNNCSLVFLGSPAKTFGMHSISSGFLFVRDKMIKKKLEDQIQASYLYEGNALSHYAILEAYQSGGLWLHEMLEYLNLNFKWVQSFLKTHLPKITVSPLQATYLIWIDFRAWKLSYRQLDTFLTKKAGVGLAPGHWFGENGKGFARMNIACSRHKIELALNKIKQAHHKML